MKKRMLSMLLCLCMALSMLPTMAMAAGTSTAPDTVWIGGIALTNGKCLTNNNATTASTYTEGASYVALYQDGVLYLNGLDKTYSGAGSNANQRALGWDYSYEGKHDLVVELVEGSVNKLEDPGQAAIAGTNGFSQGPSLTIQGKGTLNVTGGTSAIWVWEDVVVQNGATVNIFANGTSSKQAGICTNASGHGLTIKQGTTVTIHSKNYGVSADNTATGLFTVLGGNLVIKGEKAALNKLSSDFGGNTVYVSNDVSGAGATVWDGNTALTSYKYISLSGFSSTVTTYNVTKAPTSNGSFEVDYTKSMADETVTISATPDSGYEIDTVTVTDADSGNVTVDGTGNTRSFTMPAKNVTVAVSFKDVTPTYTVTYDANGGTGTAPVDSNSPYVSGSNVTVLDGGALFKTNCFFDGWNTMADGSGTAYAAGAVFAISANTTLYAQWKENISTISNFAEWQAAFANGGEYRVIADIVVTEGVTLESGKTLSIDGEGHVIRPMVTGLDEQGLVNDNATVIENIILNQGDLTLENLTIYGGKGICIKSEGTSSSKRSSLTLDGVTLERAHSSDSGAGLKNFDYSDTVLINCNIRRNASDSNSGGFRNESSSTLIMENCSIVENRNINSNSNGGGAGENKGKLYMNNCTVANNQSTEIGGGINNYHGTLYVLNSTFTGNVSTSGRSSGGGIGNNQGTVYAANSVFAFNYAGGAASDIGIYSSSTNVYLYNCTYGVIYNGTVTTVGCTQLSDSSTPKDVFNGSRISGIIKRDGTEDISNKYDRPAVLLLANGTYGVYPKTGSAVLSGGTKTYYDRVGTTVQMAYGDSATALGNLSAAATQVTKYQNGETRAAGVMGALPASNAVATVYTVVVNAAEGGSVTGGSALGNTYVAGTNLTVTAVPAEGYTFTGWKLGGETTPSNTTNPYVITNLSADVVLTPVFSPAAPTTYPTTVVTGTGSGDYEEGETVTITANAPATGYRFTGWTTADCVTFADAAAATTTFVMPAKAVTVKANYAPDTFTLTFDTDGGSTIAPITQDYNTAVTAPTAPTKTGYTFAGWDKAIPTTMPAESVTIKALWTVNQYTITFDTDGGSAIAPITQDYNSAVTKPADPVKLGYDFGGWYTDAALTTAYVFTVIPADNITVWGKWTPASGIAYTVKHYHQNTSGSGYTLYESATLRGTTENQTAAEAKNYPGFTAQTFAQTTILPDGSAVVEIKYDRNVYPVTLVTNDGTILSGNVTDYTYGVGATLPVNVEKNGYVFKGWYDNEACCDTPVTAITATDLGSKTFYAKWEMDVTMFLPLLLKHKVFVAENIGSVVTADKYETSAGGRVTLTVLPKDGYELKSVTVTDAKGTPVAVTNAGNGTFFFTMPMKDVTVFAAFTALETTGCPQDKTCPITAYTDANAKEWYHDGVHYCIENGLMKGYEDGTFQPATATSRAMIVTVLWRLEGTPVANYAMSFADVDQDAWYAEAIRWAAAQKIVEGYSDDAFGPDDAITREQLATILYRYEQYKGGGFKGTWMFRLDYTDLTEISDWATEAMYWCSMNHVIEGKPGKLLNPCGNATRAEAATMLHRYCTLSDNNNK